VHGNSKPVSFPQQEPVIQLIQNYQALMQRNFIYDIFQIPEN